jgi:membrane protease YdiL (CAAX protease family)
MPLQVGFEELIFRGYLVQGMALAFRNGLVPVLITSLLFGLAHLGNPEVQKHGWSILLPYYCMNALFLGLITLLDEGLELALGMHLANNMVSGLLVTTPNSVIQPYTVFRVPAENPQTEIVAWLAMAVTAFLIYRYRYKWTSFSLLIK